MERLAGVAQIRGGEWRELYDLKADPGETRNIIGKKTSIARDLEKKMDDIIDSCGYTPRRGGSPVT